MAPAGYEVLEGFVEQINEGGFKLASKWLNYGDRWTGRTVKAGEQIKARVRGRYLVHLVDAGLELPPEPQPRAGGGYVRAQRSPEEERRIVRQSCLKAAVDWLITFDHDVGGENGSTPRPNSSHVLKLAEKFETWVYRS